jgi:hypothetical protein
MQPAQGIAFQLEYCGASTKRCLVSILSHFLTGQATIKASFSNCATRVYATKHCLESWYSPIVSKPATKHCLAKKSLHTRLFDTGLETMP